MPTLAKYPLLTKAVARVALYWFQSVMRLTDWEVNVTISDSPPAWTQDTPANISPLGRAWENRDYKYVRVWVSPARCANDNADPLSTLFHELIHVAAWDADIPAPDKPAKEFLWNQLAPVFVSAFRAAYPELYTRAQLAATPTRKIPRKIPRKQPRKPPTKPQKPPLPRKKA